VAREVIERGIRVRYRELYREKLEDMPFLEQDYLDKIIQFSIALPPANPDLLRENIVEAHMKELKAATPYINTITFFPGQQPQDVKAVRQQRLLSTVGGGPEAQAGGACRNLPSGIADQDLPHCLSISTVVPPALRLSPSSYPAAKGVGKAGGEEYQGRRA
jgi:hypothetical protein